MWKQYRKTTITEIRPFVMGEDESLFDGKHGDFIARDPSRPNDQWLLTPEFVADNYVVVE